ncbi:hypothetical protein JL720_14382 [Aureococcus anophagefferens]|nr:hypothetical protein JL720_14382 [Aureococcus anophagefferens]
MVEEFKEVQTGADEVLSYDIDPEGVEEEEPKGLKRLFRAGPLVKAFPSWVGLSHVAKREAERDKKDGKTFGCSYEDIMKSHEVAKQKSPYPLPRSRVTGKEGGPQSVLPPTPKKLAMDDVALEEQDVNFEDMVFEDADATQGDAQTLDENDFCFEELPGDAGDASAARRRAAAADAGAVALEGLDMSDLSFEECADETLAREPPSHKEDMKWTDDDFARAEAPREAAEKAQPSTTSTPRSSFTRGSVCLPRPGESEGCWSSPRCLDPLVALLNDGDARVAEEAAGCLWSLAIDDRNKVAIVAAGARLAMLRESGDEPTKTVEHAAGVLQNLAMLDEHQKPIYDAGCLPALVALLSAAGDVGRENAAGCLRNLATADDLELEVAAAGAPEPLCALLFHGTPLCAANAHGALQNMTFQAESRLKVAELGRPDLADDAATPGGSSASVAPPAKSGGAALPATPQRPAQRGVALAESTFSAPSGTSSNLTPRRAIVDAPAPAAEQAADAAPL